MRPMERGKKDNPDQSEKKRAHTQESQSLPQEKRSKKGAEDGDEEVEDRSIGGQRTRDTECHSGLGDELASYSGDDELVTMTPYDGESISMDLASCEDERCEQKRDHMQWKNGNGERSHFTVEHFDRDSLAGPE